MQPTDPSVIIAIIVAVLIGALIGWLATAIYYAPRIRRLKTESWAAARRFYLHSSSTDRSSNHNPKSVNP